MKKLLLPLLLTAVMVIAGCGKTGTGDKSAAPLPSSTASTTAASSDAPQSTGTSGATGASGAGIDTGGTNIERMSPEEVAGKEVANGRTENAFTGQWYAAGTTSDNAAFSALDLKITKDSYTVVMSFDDYEGSVECSGKYTIKNGVLTFDENFSDCTAYFYKGDMYTLVLDNGTSLVFCKHLEQESEMR